MTAREVGIPDNIEQMSPEMEAAPPRVFISYSHDSPEHAEQVLALADRLVADGIDVVLDQYATAPAEGWNRWMRKGIRDSNFVLVIPTAIYKRRAEGDEEAGKGQGVNREGLVIDQTIYNEDGRNSKFIAVVLHASDRKYVPDFLTPYQGESAATDSDYESLYRRLTNQPAVVRPELGKLRALAPRERKSSFRAQTSATNSVWNIPAPSVNFFGREEYLRNLREALVGGKAAALTQKQTQAIRGLGGMGKTETAKAYAARHRAEYSCGFWMTADSASNLETGFVQMARALGLPEADAKDAKAAAMAAKKWLESNENWLLILDNVDAIEDVKAWIPAAACGSSETWTRVDHDTAERCRSDCARD